MTTSVYSLVVAGGYGEEDMKIELKEEELEGCITKDEYANLWEYARIRTAEDMLGRGWRG